MRAWEPATKWRDGAPALLSGEFEQAAEIYADIGAAPDEALARCHAARVLVAEGKRTEADRHLRRALDFYRSVGATRYAAEADQLRAASA